MQNIDDSEFPEFIGIDGQLTVGNRQELKAAVQTAKDYKDFELFVDWKIGPGGDSGFRRCAEWVGLACSHRPLLGRAGDPSGGPGRSGRAGGSNSMLPIRAISIQ